MEKGTYWIYIRKLESQFGGCFEMIKTKSTATPPPQITNLLTKYMK